MWGIINDSGAIWDNPYPIGENNDDSIFFSKIRLLLEHKLIKVAYFA